MDQRTKSILETSIEEFIETGKPITSGRLYKKYDFGIKPAMIRRELSDWDNADFLSQIHTAGGRIPTNKAYRFFVKNLRAENLEPKVSKREGKEMIEKFLSNEMNLVTKMMAKYLNTLNAIYEPNKNRFFSSGLEDLFENIEIEEKDELKEIIRDFEKLPQRLSEAVNNKDKKRELEIYIGENPFTKSNYLSLISEEFNLNNEEILLLTIGPRRMDYRKSICVYRFFEDETN